MNKKKIFMLFCIAIVACTSILLVIYSYNNHKENTKEVAISEIDMKTVDDLMIGSDPPKLLYADKEKVIFDCLGVYVYDMKNKVLAKSFDTSSLVPDKHTKLSSFVTKDGKYIIFGFSKGISGVWYGYSFKDDLVKELTEDEYKSYREKMFICTRLKDYEDELYQKSSGTIVKISDNEYVYLTFKNWKLSTIQVVYVNGVDETRYSVFDNVR
jgi:hypothetical protein